MPPPFFEFDGLTIVTTIFWIWMLVDCYFNKRLKGGPSRRIFWLLLIFCTHIVGALIYFFLECTRRNPVEAFQYYYQRITKDTRAGKPPQQGQMPPPHYYADYQRGYQAQQRPPMPAPPTTQKQPPVYQPYTSQPQYEEPTATYPEMPMELPPQQ